MKKRNQCLINMHHVKCSWFPSTLRQDVQRHSQRASKRFLTLNQKHSSYVLTTKDSRASFRIQPASPTIWYRFAKTCESICISTLLFWCGPGCNKWGVLCKFFRWSVRKRSSWCWYVISRRRKSRWTSTGTSMGGFQRGKQRHYRKQINKSLS